MIISLVNKIIRISPTCKTIMQGDQKKEILVKIPRKLLSDSLEKSKVSMLVQLNDNEIKKDVLSILTDDEEYVFYLWDLKEEYTAEEGILQIQIKIEIKISEEIVEPIEPEKPVEPSEGDTEIEGEATGSGTIILNLEDDEIDPDIMVSTFNNKDIIWYSYKNSFLIDKSLIKENL